VLTLLTGETNKNIAIIKAGSLWIDGGVQSFADFANSTAAQNGQKTGNATIGISRFLDSLSPKATFTLRRTSTSSTLQTFGELPKHHACESQLKPFFFVT
jgi:hypothetical protein